MEVEVRVVRARVWLSSSLFLRQDGFLSLTRVGETDHVAHASIRSVEAKSGDQHSIADAARVQGQQKCFRSVTVAWEDQTKMPATSCPRFSLPNPQTTPMKTSKPVGLPRLDFQLFLLRPCSRGGTSARSRPQTVYIGTSGWQLSEKDLEALVSSREVVFLTKLQDDLGTLEVKLRCVSSSSTADPAVENEAEAPTGFNINWSSSEALQKDLAEKARLKAEADKKLILQLKQTALKAAKLVETRDYLLVHFYRSRAATRIQRLFRALQNKKEECSAKLRQEEGDRIAAKKAQVRDKVIARNRQRALAMRVRLQEYLDNKQTSCCPKRVENPMSRRMAEHVEEERAKLKQTLAVLKVQRKQFTTRNRSYATAPNQRSSQQPSDKLFDNELVRAVQELHFTRPYSNQM